MTPQACIFVRINPMSTQRHMFPLLQQQLLGFHLPKIGICVLVGKIVILVDKIGILVGKIGSLVGKIWILTGI